MRSPDLSIVFAVNSDSPSDDALASLHQACRGLSVELIITVAGVPPLSAAFEANFPGSRMQCCPAGTLTPVLWGAGVGPARAPCIAFTTHHLRVAPTWARALLSALASGAVGVGGPIELGPDPDAATAAAYFIRFSAFSPQIWPAPTPARDIPGDNAAYRKEALLRHADLLEDGFWEVEFHRRFQHEGGMLQMEPGARASLIGPVPFGQLLQQRYRHAREFGSSRVQRHGERRLKLLLLAPLVPLVLLARMVARVLPAARERRLFLGALPWLVLLSTAWAAGEAAGAARGWGRAAS